MVRTLHETERGSPGWPLAASAWLSVFPSAPAPVVAEGTPTRPLFPSYLFVRCDLAEVTVDELQFLPGLRRIVEFAGKPAIVSDEAIEMMARELDEIEAAGGLLKHSFKPGDTVVIDSGPLAGLRGVFQGPMGPSERVRILVRSLARPTGPRCPLESLRKAGEDEVGPRRRRGTRGRGRRVNYEP